MKVKAIIREVILSPGELEKWVVNSNDWIFIKSDESINVTFKRINVELTKKTPGLFQCSHRSFFIQNIRSIPSVSIGRKF
ncbi:hypothetical protein J2T13_004980 [Paenibacillus sp. DS2015]|uniref:hypothetical protein n=1 Tax=Paenibacillus sp. DS2015 TaxID=3373917 RepID=UPI003D1D2638